MERGRINIIILIFFICFSKAYAQDIFFPTDTCIKIVSQYCNDKGEIRSFYTLSVKNVKGTPSCGSQDIVYNFCKEDGNPFFNDPNEFSIHFTRKDNTTSIETSEMKKMLFVQGILPLGDASSIPATIQVGDTIATSILTVKAGFMKTTITTSGRKVLDHKEITTKAGKFDAWLIQEDIETKFLVDLGNSTAKTWYVRNIGGVNQKIFDKNGKLKSSSEIVEIK